MSNFVMKWIGFVVWKHMLLLIAYFILAIFSNIKVALWTFNPVGKELYSRNLKLLVPFFDCPSIQLQTINKVIWSCDLIFFWLWLKNEWMDGVNTFFGLLAKINSKCMLLGSDWKQIFYCFLFFCHGGQNFIEILVNLGCIWLLRKGTGEYWAASFSWIKWSVPRKVNFRLLLIFMLYMTAE